MNHPIVGQSTQAMSVNNDYLSQHYMQAPAPPGMAPIRMQRPLVNVAPVASHRMQPPLGANPSSQIMTGSIIPPPLGGHGIQYSNQIPDYNIPVSNRFDALYGYTV